MYKEHWQDCGAAAIGLWLFVSPWVFGAPGAGDAAAWDFWIVGIAVIALAISEIAAFQPWKEWLIAGLGTWLLVSPRLLIFLEARALTWNAAICGLTLVALAGWSIGDRHEILPRLRRPKGDLRGDMLGISLPDESAHLAGLPQHQLDTGPDIVHPGGSTQTPGQVSHE